MDCPVCKYPNPPGATHCGMCYEVFNRSAAQNYILAVKREQRETEEEKAPKSPVSSGGILEKAGAAMNRVDWPVLGSALSSLLRRSWIVLAIGLGLIGLWMANSFLLNPSSRFHLFGLKIEYAFLDKVPAQYLVVLTQEIKCWSERQGRLDTPMEQYKLEDIGNVLFEKMKTTGKNRKSVVLRVREWIEILHDAKGSASHAVSLNHPSLARTRVIFDKKGTLLDRRDTLSPRLAKGLPFLTPKFPGGTLHRGRTWVESVEWVDIYGDWKIYWSGTLHWTLGDLELCGEGTCAHLTYQADLRPQLWAWPSWAAKAVHRVDASVSADGVAVFDAGHKRLVSNIFTYEGLLHIPLKDLGRIPWDLRIGRRVKGPGEIVMHFANKIDIRKN